MIRLALIKGARFAHLRHYRRLVGAFSSPTTARFGLAVAREAAIAKQNANGPKKILIEEGEGHRINGGVAR